MSSNALLRAPVITPLPWPLPGAVADKIAAIGVPASLVRSLQTLHYHVAGGPDEDPRYLAAIIGEEARDGAAFLPQGVPKILLSAGPSFDTRRAAAEAGIEAVVRWPAGLPPILDWLDVFEARLRARRPSVLLISDDPVLARDDSAALLRAGLEATAAIGPAAAIQALDYHVPDLLIIDTGQTTVRDGLELARMLRQSHTCHDLPAIFWGAAEGFRPAPPVISHRDCLLPRPPDAAALVRDVLPCAQRARDARDIAAQDPLTRLLHRMSFETRGAAELAQTRRTGGICSLALLKIDGFEDIGTQFGEPACDHVLKAMARLLRCRLRSSDLTASLGNGAFAVLLSGAAPGCARSALDALQSGFAQIVFEQGAEAFQTGFRFGLCGSHGLSWPKMWDYAGRALVSELNFRPDS